MEMGVVPTVIFVGVPKRFAAAVPVSPVSAEPDFVPANLIGHTQFSVGQLKILQEVITLSVFVPVAILYLKEPVRLNYLWAALCLCGAVYFVFRG